MDKRPLLAFGHFNDRQRKTLSSAAIESAFDVSVVGAAQEASHWLADHQPHAMLFQGTTLDGMEPRADARHAQVPIIALAKELTDLAFAEVFSWGGDDVVALDNPRSLVGRLRALPKAAPEPPTNGRGTALVADPDQTRRIVLGRVLRNAGYSVTFAAADADAQGYAEHPEIDLVVLNTELSPEPRALIERSRAVGANATWVLTCPPRELGRTRKLLAGLDRTSAMDGFAPPENVLFLANELSGARRTNQRKSPRLLFGTTVAFRGAGRDHDDYGYSYNISAGGLYVRTLLPPEDNQVWLELTPPRSERRVRLVGKVVWRRGFAPNGMATVPPGFGVQLVDGAKADMDAWYAGYEAFSSAMA